MLRWCYLQGGDAYRNRVQLPVREVQVALAVCLGCPQAGLTAGGLPCSPARLLGTSQSPWTWFAQGTFSQLPCHSVQSCLRLVAARTWQGDTESSGLTWGGVRPPQPWGLPALTLETCQNRLHQKHRRGQTSLKGPVCDCPKLNKVIFLLIIRPHPHKSDLDPRPTQPHRTVPLNIK